MHTPTRCSAPQLPAARRAPWHVAALAAAVRPGTNPRPWLRCHSLSGLLDLRPRVPLDLRPRVRHLPHKTFINDACGMGAVVTAHYCDQTLVNTWFWWGYDCARRLLIRCVLWLGRGSSRPFFQIQLNLQGRYESTSRNDDCTHAYTHVLGRGCNRAILECNPCLSVSEHHLPCLPDPFSQSGGAQTVVFRFGVSSITIIGVSNRWLCIGTSAELSSRWC
jgi:hypothetical protein